MKFALKNSIKEACFIPAKILKFAILKLITVYRFVAKFTPSVCRFQPTCSKYTMDEIEKFAQMNSHEIATSQWYDFSISAIFSAYKGDYEKTKDFLSEMRKNQKTVYAENFIDKLEETLENKWKGE